MTHNEKLPFPDELIRLKVIVYNLERIAVYLDIYLIIHFHSQQHKMAGVNF